MLKSKVNTKVFSNKLYSLYSFYDQLNITLCSNHQVALVLRDIRSLRSKNRIPEH